MNRIDAVDTARRLENVDVYEVNDMCTTSGGSADGCSTRMERQKSTYKFLIEILKGILDLGMDGWIFLKWILTI
jgi:hypothetical protein